MEQAISKYIWNYLAPETMRNACVCRSQLQFHILIVARVSCMWILSIHLVVEASWHDVYPWWFTPSQETTTTAGDLEIVPRDNNCRGVPSSSLRRPHQIHLRFVMTQLQRSGKLGRISWIGGRRMRHEWSMDTLFRMSHVALLARTALDMWN